MYNCSHCGDDVDTEREGYRKVTDMQRVTRHWHNTQTRPCWAMHTRTYKPQLQLVPRKEVATI